MPAQNRSEPYKLRKVPTDKENVPPRHGSREDITALPMSARLDQSPHLRPVDLQKPPIPYNFRPQSMSQASVQQQEDTASPARPRTLLSKRSIHEHGTPSRRTSSKHSKRRNEPLREEEIRALSQPIPIPKRAGDHGPLRRDSKKVRGNNGKDSQVSLPPEGSIRSSMSGILEQRGWEIGGFAVFSPRPNVRLSGTPQYVSNSVPGSSGFLYRIDSTGGKDRPPGSPETGRKRRTVGDEAESLDSSNLRAIMERDAKRKAQRQQERQDKLERKLRAREGRNRGDSDRRRRDADEAKRIEEGRSRAAEQLQQAQGRILPPTAVHPAMREPPSRDDVEPNEGAAVGLGIAKAPPPATSRPESHTAPAADDEDVEGGEGNDPFADAHEELPPPSPMVEEPQAVAGASRTLEPPTEEEPAVVGQAVRMSITSTPPMSPVHTNRGLRPSASQMTEESRQQSISAASASDLPAPPRIPVERRSSDPPKDKRAGTWAAFFRRGGSNLRKTQNEGRDSPSHGSFSNTSRDSMRNQPLPAHLVGTERSPTVRSTSGTPARTQSKFREDLPESPADSRTQSPEATATAAAVAAAKRAGRSTPQPVDIPGRARDLDRNDTPVSQGVRGHTAMTGSMASIDSEGSWLASGSAQKRASNQSALSRSLSRRNEFNSSYEELGGDKDAEYFSRNLGSTRRKLSSPALIGAGPDEESEEGDAEAGAEPAVTPFTMHESVRRKPTLVERDHRLKSTEGLVAESAAAEQVETPFSGSPHESTEDAGEPSDEEDPFDLSTGGETSLERARSVQYSSRHSRQFSAGSAKLLDVPSRRMSVERSSREGSKSPEPPASASQSQTQLRPSEA